MLAFFLAGGWMMFVVLAVGVPLVATAAKFARSASPQGLSLVRTLGKAVAFAAVTGVITDLAATAKAVATIPELNQHPLECLLVGFAESMAPAILGFSLVTIAWILVAFGVRRMPAP
ncbi:hypothetical protein BH11MYX1_BH11MYX1_15620 [soil metagenome]